jgi:hypothetical protein
MPGAHVHIFLAEAIRMTIDYVIDGSRRHPRAAPLFAIRKLTDRELRATQRETGSVHFEHP